MKATLVGISGGQRDNRHDIAQPERKRTGFTPPPRPRLDHPNTHRMDTPTTTDAREPAAHRPRLAAGPACWLFA